MTVTYLIAPRDKWLWCESHHRIATHWCVRHGCERPDLNPPQIHCDPSLAGITLPCRCVPVEEHYKASADASGVLP